MTKRQTEEHRETHRDTQTQRDTDGRRGTQRATERHGDTWGDTGMHGCTERHTEMCTEAHGYIHKTCRHTHTDTQ